MRFKYNILAALQVLFSLLFYFQLASTFGATSQSDSFLVSFSIITAVQLLQLMFVEQSLFFYQQNKSESEYKAKTFYLNALGFSVLVGFFFYVIFYILSDKFVELYLVFGKGGDTELMKNIFFYFCLGLLVYPATYVNDRVLNAEGKFSLPYISETLPYVSMFLYFLYFKIANKVPDIHDVAISRVVGMAGGLLVTSSVLIKNGFFKYKYIKLEVDFLTFVRNSFMMRLSHNINNFGVNFIVNSFLISLPEGFASIYHYAFKGVTIIKQIIVGPLYRVFQTELTEILYSKKFENIRDLTGGFEKKSIILYVVLLVVSWFLIEPVLNFIMPLKFESVVIRNISIYFLMIGCWHAFMVAELSKITLYMAIKDFKVFLLANTFIVTALFLVTYFFEITLTEFVITNIVLQACSYFYYLMLFDRKLQQYAHRNTN